MDLHKNFAVSLVATAPSPATSGTSLVVTAGQGALFPTPPFNLTIWPTAAQPTAAIAEVVRCTGISTDTLTITRAQESSSARTVVVGDQIAATVTAKSLTDIETVASAAYTAGGTDVAVADGGTGASTAAAARTNLGLPDIPWTVVTKASDQSIASSTVLTNDTELFFTAVNGAFYEVMVSLIYGSPSGAGTPDIKLAFGEDATIRGSFGSLGGIASTEAAWAILQNAASNQTAAIAPGTAAADRLAPVIGSHNGAGGTFRVLWAQNTSGVNATIVRAGSILRYRRLL